MSTTENTIWLESAQEALEYMIDTYDYAMAKNLISDVADKGFEDEARDLEKQLLDSPLSAFVVSLNVQSL